MEFLSKKPLLLLLHCLDSYPSQSAKPSIIHTYLVPVPVDEMVLELAVHGAADALITHNINDFKDAAVAFGLRVVKPADFLHELNTQGLAP